MQHTIIDVGPQRYLDLTHGGPSLNDERDVLDLVALSWETDTTLFLLHGDRLPEAFFDLKSGLAGAALQKFTNYGLKGALILPDPSGHDARFHEMTRESGRGRTFAVFGTRHDAETWLLA